MPELCQNPMALTAHRLLIEREQIPQVVDNRAISTEPLEGLEQVPIFRNQQVAGSSQAGGSRDFKHLEARAMRASVF